jgi:RNA polymerase sigma-70 factor (sigma-E family)
MTEWPEAFREFATSRTTPLHRSAYLLCGDWHLAHDLVQETLIKALRHWKKVQQADSPEAYVRGILLNTVRDGRRRTAPTVPLADAAEPAVRDRTDEVGRRDELFQALLRLPFRQRATVVLRYLEGLSEKETAAVLRCSQGTVKSQSSHALAALRSHLSREVMS